MILDQDKIDKIRDLLKKNPKGLTISEISQKVNLNRNSLAKYLEILLVSGQVEMESFGTAKVYYLSQRVPVSALLKFSTDLIILLDSNLQVVQINDNVLAFFETKREEILGKHFPTLSLLPIPELVSRPSALDIFENGEIIKEVAIPHREGTVFFRIKLVPTVFDDGGKGITIIAEDTTLQKEYEERLKASEGRYRAIVEDQTELICRRLPDDTITFVNAAYCRYFNLDMPNILGQKVLPEVTVQDQRIRADMRCKITPAEPVITYEVRTKMPEGSICWQQWTDRALYNENGSIQEYQSVGRDITDRKAAEQELRIMESAIASSINGIAIFDPDERLLYANRSFMEISEFSSPSDSIGKPTSLLYSSDQNIMQRLPEIKESLAAEGRWLGEIDTTWKSGEPLNLQISCTRVVNDDGGVICSLVSIVNITEQKQMEEAFKRTYGKLQESIEFMADPTFIVDREKKVVAWNHAMEGFTGVSKGRMLGRRDLKGAFPFFEGIRPILIDLIDMPAEEIAKYHPNVRLFGDSIFTEAFVPSLHDGRGAYIWGKASRLSGSEGSYIGAIESMRDISDWKKAEDSLRQVYEKSRLLQTKE